MQYQHSSIYSKPTIGYIDNVDQSENCANILLSYIPKGERSINGTRLVVTLNVGQYWDQFTEL